MRSTGRREVPASISSPRQTTHFSSDSSSANLPESSKYRELPEEEGTGEPCYGKFERTDVFERVLRSSDSQRSPSPFLGIMEVDEPNSPAPANGSLKRKERERDEQDVVKQKEEQEEPGGEENSIVVRTSPPAKKAKKTLTKKVAVWKDIKQWKEGDAPLGVFPIELLDMVSSGVPSPPLALPSSLPSASSPSTLWERFR